MKPIVAWFMKPLLTSQTVPTPRFHRAYFSRYTSSTGWLDKIVSAEKLQISIHFGILCVFFLGLSLLFLVPIILTFSSPATRSVFGTLICIIFPTLTFIVSSPLRKSVLVRSPNVIQNQFHKQLLQTLSITVWVFKCLNECDAAMNKLLRCNRIVFTAKNPSILTTSSDSCLQASVTCHDYVSGIYCLGLVNKLRTFFLLLK